MQHKKWLPVLFLVFANLAPLAGVLWADWNAAIIILLYWSENIVIGIYNILKMIFAGGKVSSNVSGRIITILFFCLHYGAFCVAHGYFILNLLEIGSESSAAVENSWPGPLALIQSFLSIINRLLDNMPDEMIWPLLALCVSHGISFIYNFFILGEYKQVVPKDLMSQPYKRIVVMHVTIIAAGVLITNFNSSLPMLFILILIKIVMDIHLHNKEHGSYLFNKTKLQNQVGKN